MPFLANVSNAIRRFLRFLLARPLMWISNRYTSFPDQKSVNKSLDELYKEIVNGNTKKGRLVNIDPQLQSIIIFSDQHKGARTGSDDFELSEKNYLKALAYYNQNKFALLALGDSEELWENTVLAVMKNYKDTFEAEALFAQRDAFYKVYGNHDLFWDNDPFASTFLKKMYGLDVSIYSGIVFRIALDKRTIDIFCTHGHQGDKQSDGNALSKWFISYIWGPMQSYLKINTNNPSTNDDLKTLHNEFMYQWSSKQNNIILITGHTHQPVFGSLTHLERLLLRREEALQANDGETLAKIDAEIPRRKNEYDYIKQSFREVRPGYFNSGCCCYKDGNITGIEIAENSIRLIKWSKGERIVAEEAHLSDLKI
ncbi:MAG TPA: metallophosphoesterase [Chitinophagaceae bacterium]|nr:metallophosphoesterase [Chitinophagaceae bacterium]